MEFSTPMVRGKLIKRYKRFFADVSLENGKVVTAHCPNTGSMKSCGSPGDHVVLSYNPSPKRKLDYSWEYTSTAGGFIGINTHRPNRVIEEALHSGAITELSGYDTVQREVKYGEKSRIDFLLTDSSAQRPPCYVEVKNATLKVGDDVKFPDAVTARGLKHLEELASIAKEGTRAVLLFFVNRPDVQTCQIAEEIDSKYYEQLGRSIAEGVEVLAYRADSSLEEIKLGAKVPFVYQ